MKYLRLERGGGGMKRREVRVGVVWSWERIREMGGRGGGGRGYGKGRGRGRGRTGGE